MQGIMKNSKNRKNGGAFAVCMHTTKDIWSLHTHGKGATWRKLVLLVMQWAIARTAANQAHGKAFAVQHR
jgi:hypothetical protein